MVASEFVLQQPISMNIASHALVVHVAGIAVVGVRPRDVRLFGQLVQVLLDLLR